MIVQKHISIGGRDFVRTASDAGRYVVRDGISYSEAYDPAELGRNYTEGEPMPPEELADAISAKAEAYDILMGGDIE